jgi:hypothetical protein
MSVYSSISNDSNMVGLSSGCSYTTLGQYSATAAGRGVSMPQASFLLVPNYGMSASYTTLQHGDVKKQPMMTSCQKNPDYFSIQQAYGSCPTTFTSLANVNCARK